VCRQAGASLRGAGDKASLCPAAQLSVSLQGGAPGRGPWPGGKAEEDLDHSQAQEKENGERPLPRPGSAAAAVAPLSPPPGR